MTTNNESSNKSFQLTISFISEETGKHVSFKHDGSRFKTSQKTFKFRIDSNYKINLRCDPQLEFQSLHIAGTDLMLIKEKEPGEFSTVWNTTGIEASKKGTREDILLILTSNGRTLRSHVQTKFYANNDGHAEWGNKLKAIVWKCVFAGDEIKIKDEALL